MVRHHYPPPLKIINWVGARIVMEQTANLLYAGAIPVLPSINGPIVLMGEYRFCNPKIAVQFCLGPPNAFLAQLVEHWPEEP